MDITLTLTADQADLVAEHLGDSDAVTALLCGHLADLLERKVTDAAAEQVNESRKAAIVGVADTLDTLRTPAEPAPAGKR